MVSNTDKLVFFPGNTAHFLKVMTRVQKLTVLPRTNAAPAPIVAPMESATKPTGSPKR